ncbi:MAG: cytochrome c biogenesis protein CcsA [Saprospiraceae bacterium]|nr:cytochrome c biogenesis protein CcsA [Saprospiraceae bacterium]
MGIVIKHWWKALCVVLLTYVLWYGLKTPLKPGILEIFPDRARAGENVELNIKGYNTHFLASPVLVYIKSSDQHWIKAQSISVIDDSQLKANFQIPKHLPASSISEQYSVIISSELDGSSVFPSRLILQQDTINTELAKSEWNSENPDLFALKANSFPFRNILYETIRNTFFHVSLWFAMFALLGSSVYYSAKYLRGGNLLDDLQAYSKVRIAVLFGVLGLITGSVWAKNTWGTWWTNDIKLNMSAISMLIYLAYLIIRSGIEDPDKKARVSSSYNIFALVAVIPLIFVLPRLTDSLHPGNGGNPAFGSEDMDNSLRIVFYPAVIGFILLGLWLSSLLYRVDYLFWKQQSKEN